ncbi:MAG: multiheme c-type cytochrome [Planctomycetota bacterium]
MNRTVRVVFAVVLVLGLALLGIEIGWAQGGDHAGTADTPRGWQSSQQCKECHQDVWDEWHGSHHQIAYLNPDVRLLSDDFRNKECQACHLPRPVSITGYGQRTLPRMTLPDEGVSCLTCHLGKAGEILGRREIKTAPCRPQQSAELVSVEMCASCHNQHGTTATTSTAPPTNGGPATMPGRARNATPATCRKSSGSCRPAARGRATAMCSTARMTKPSSRALAPSRRWRQVGSWS